MYMFYICRIRLLIARNTALEQKDSPDVQVKKQPSEGFQIWGEGGSY